MGAEKGEFLRVRQRDAKQNARKIGVFKTKHLNMWVQARNAYLAALAEQVALDAQTAEEGSGTEASVANIRAFANLPHYLSPRNTVAAMVPVDLTDGATIAWDMATGINFKVTIGAAGRALANPTNQSPGKSGFINVFQDGTGGRSITSWGNNFVWIGDPPYWPTAPGKRTKIAYFVNDIGDIELSFSGNQK